MITLDVDFADIGEYPPATYPGIIVLRTKRQDKLFVLELFERVIRLLQNEPIDNLLWIIEENRLRIRS